MCRKAQSQLMAEHRGQDYPGDCHIRNLFFIAGTNISYLYLDEQLHKMPLVLHAE